MKTENWILMRIGVSSCQSEVKREELGLLTSLQRMRISSFIEIEIEDLYLKSILSSLMNHFTFDLVLWKKLSIRSNRFCVVLNKEKGSFSYQSSFTC